jgi:hypothetical protein
MGVVNNICVSQGGFFSIPIVNAGGNGSKIPALFGDPLRCSPTSSTGAGEETPDLGSLGSWFCARSKSWLI